MNTKAVTGLVQSWTFWNSKLSTEKLALKCIVSHRLLKIYIHINICKKKNCLLYLYDYSLVNWKSFWWLE